MSRKLLWRRRFTDRGTGVARLRPESAASAGTRPTMLESRRQSVLLVVFALLMVVLTTLVYRKFYIGLAGDSEFSAAGLLGQSN